MMSSKQSLSNCTTADVSRSPNCDSKSTGDNLSQLSQPTSETSLHSEISAEKYQRLATQFAKVIVLLAVILTVKLFRLIASFSIPGA